MATAIQARLPHRPPRRLRALMDKAAGSAPKGHPLPRERFTSTSCLGRHPRCTRAPRRSQDRAAGDHHDHAVLGVAQGGQILSVRCVTALASRFAGDLA